MDKKKLIRNSIDVRCYVSEILAVSIGLLLVALLTITGVFASKTAAMLMWVIYGPLYVAVVGFCIYKLIRITREPDRYEVYKAEVLSSHYALSVLKGAMYLEIVVAVEEGARVHIESAGVFSRSLFSKRYHGRFVGTSVRVLYDRVTGTVLVVE